MCKVLLTIMTIINQIKPNTKLRAYLKTHITGSLYSFAKHALLTTQVLICIFQCVNLPNVHYVLGYINNSSSNQVYHEHSPY